MQLLGGAEPFTADAPDLAPGSLGADLARGGVRAGRVGVVVAHGFTGTPASVLPWAQSFAASGYSVRLPRLPGHGTRWQDLNNTVWTQWYDEIRYAYDDLSAQCDLVFAAGLSMGGTLVTRLAEDVGPGIAGLLLVNPAYGTARRDAAFAKYLAWAVPSRTGIASDIKKPGSREPGYDRTPLKAFVSLQRLWRCTVADLAKVTAPIVLFKSTEDHVVDELSVKLLLAGATATTIHRVALPNSYHVATLDYDAEMIFAQSALFVDRIRAGVRQ